MSDTAELSDFKAGRGVDVPASSKQLKTVTFTADDVHDFAWFASKRWGYVTKQINVGDKKVLARVVAAEPNIEDLSHIETAITYYSSHVGEYPYSHATVVHGELKAGGGMEYPMITLCDYMDREVIVHEVGHNWFYGILASNERRYPWMDESINSFYEGEAISVGLKKASDINQNIMQMMASDNMLCHKHQAISSSSEELTNENYGVSIYGYGAEAFGYLKAYLGDAMFKKCMRAYYDEWKFKHPLPGDMQAVYERVSEEDLSWFFKDFLDSDQRLDYSISESSEGFVLKNVSSIKAPVPVDVTIAGKTNTTWYSVAPGEELLIPAIGDDKSAIIDPKGKTLEMNTANNMPHRKLQLKGFFGKDDPAKNEIYMVPTLGYNIYDKMMWGVGIHNYTLKNKPLQYMVLPMYSFTTKKLNGVASVNYTKPLKGIASFIDVGVGVRRFSFKTKSVLLDQQYSYTKMAPYLTYVLPKKSQRSPVERSWKLQYDFVGMTPQFDIDRGDTLSGSLPFEKNRQFVTLTYLKENKRAINGYSLRLMAEYGMSNIVNVLADFDNPGYYDEDSVRKFFPYLKDEWIKNDMLKLSGVLNYNVDFGLKDKPLEIRLFGSYIAKSMGNTTYDNNIGSRDKAGYYDYRMDDVLMGRNATEGLFQNQISRNGDFSKFVGPIYTNQTWMATANITMPLPGKLPLKPYVEFFMADGLDQRTWVNGKSFLYNAGFELEVVPNRFEIFFNLWQSEEVTNYQDGTAGGLNYPFTVSSFAERITFVLDLQNLRPDKLKRSMSFF